MSGIKNRLPIVNKISSLKKMSNFKSKESNKAIIRFELGPAIEIKAASFLGFFKLKGSKGTGFPQPKPKKSKKSVPMKSRWENGLRFSLP